MCEFCNIANKKKEVYMVYESDNAVAFLDMDPINEGHVLIVPRIHEASIHKMPIHILTEIMELAQKIVTALERIYDMDGYSIMQNGGQYCDFGHFHLHVFPRYKKDGFGWVCPDGPFEYSQNVATKIAEAIDEEEGIP